MTEQAVASTARLDEAAQDNLAASLRGVLLRPIDAQYEEARKIWNGMIDRRPALIVQCAVAADVAEAVRFARERDLTISVRGGGHGVGGLAVADDALMIDLSLMRGVWVGEWRPRRVAGCRSVRTSISPAGLRAPRRRVSGRRGHADHHRGGAPMYRERRAGSRTGGSRLG